MPTLQVDTLKFDFNVGVAAQIYDRWQHYLVVWNVPGGQKAVDVVAVEGAPPQGTTWLIEAKDFRVIGVYPPKPSNIAGLAQFVAEKAAHTLAGLTHASGHAVVAGEKKHAADALASATRRIVLHLEPHTGPRTALFPTGFAASVLQKLRQLAKALDPNALVLNIANTPMSGVPWTVS